MMARQGQSFVIPARWIKIGSAIIAIGAVAGPAFGVVVSYLIRDATQDSRITALENNDSTSKALDKIDARLSRIEQLLMEHRR